MAILVQGFQRHAQGLMQNRKTGDIPLFPFLTDGLQLHRGGIVHGSVNFYLVAHIEALAKAAGFPGEVCHRDSGMVIARFAGGEGKMEAAAGIGLLLPFKDRRTITLHLHGNACAGKAVAGKTLQLAAHGNAVPGHVKFLQLVEDEFVGRKHKLIDPERLVRKLIHFQGEQAVAKAFGQHKAARYRAKRIGGKFLTVKPIALGIQQPHLHGTAFANREAPRRIPFKHHRLETDGVAGMIRPLILIEVALRGTFACMFHAGFPQAHRPRLPLAAHRHHLIIALATELLDKGRWQRGETAEFEGGFGHLAVSFHQ